MDVSELNTPERIARREKIKAAPDVLRAEIARGAMEDRAPAIRLNHYFVQPDKKYGCAVYAREMSAPAGTYIVSKIHRYDHLVFLMKGKISVASDQGVACFEAPCTIISKAGVQRIGHVIEDCIWTTVHLTEHYGEENLDKIEEEVIAKSFAEIGLIDSAKELGALR